MSFYRTCNCINHSIAFDRYLTMSGQYIAAILLGHMVFLTYSGQNYTRAI